MYAVLPIRNLVSVIQLESLRSKQRLYYTTTIIIIVIIVNILKYINYIPFSHMYIETVHLKAPLRKQVQHSSPDPVTNTSPAV